MMSIAQVRSAGSAGNYYTDKDNYYVLGSMGERWAGKGAEQLGLQGSVDKDVFTRLLEGRLPDGADLSRMQDGSNKHRPGYDLTFSAPKSVSMMAMLGGDKRLIDAHNQAVDFAVRQVEALASTRVMTDGQSETVLTGNLVMALFNHDTSRDQEPQLHTHAVVANVTQHNGEWKTLSSDKVGKTGFIENVYANQIAFGRLYREKLKEQVEALGYETEVVGKHGMWEMPGVPVEAFSGRSQAIREAVGEDASLKSRDVAALDTRKSKQHVDPEIRMAEWMQTLKETGFDIRAYRDAADQRAEILQRAGVFSLQQPMPPGIKPPQHCASPEPFRLAADSTTVFLFRNPSLLHSVLRIPQNIIRLQPLHFSYEKGRRVSPLRPSGVAEKTLRFCSSETTVAGARCRGTLLVFDGVINRPFSGTSQSHAFTLLEK